MVFSKKVFGKSQTPNPSPSPASEGRGYTAQESPALYTGRDLGRGSSAFQIASTRRHDLLSLLFLVGLCWLFFWRLLTPVPLNQQSMVEGDFSGQFVPFANYQAQRFAQGEVPLWNPYNYAGHPFLADTQSAVFYPPRLVTIGLLNATGGSTPQRMYDALQKEMIFHTLLASWLMYCLVRRLTFEQAHSILASLIAALTFAYGGYFTGYPQLQLAVMEAGVWLPLALLGIHEATRSKPIRWRWFGLAGIALGLSFLAGHPQTTLFFGYASLGYLGYRVYTAKYSWRVFLIGALLFGVIGGGLAAVQLLPGWEFQSLTTRNNLSFDAMGNGFPLYDTVQMILPGIVSLWSPLYVGYCGLALAIYALWKRSDGALFWGALAGIALLLSYGKGTIFYDLVYNLAPGFSLFREQERSAFLFSTALAILAGLGTSMILNEKERLSRYYLYLLRGGASVTASLGGVLFVNWLLVPGADGKRLSVVALSIFAAAATAALLGYGRNTEWKTRALLGLVIFELFSFGRYNPNVENRPASTRLEPSPLVEMMQKDTDGIFRVDSLGQNYGTLYGIADIQGISPLRPATIDRLLSVPPERMGRIWDVLAVRYVTSYNKQLVVPSEIITSTKSPNYPDPLNLHKLSNPRPFARLVYKVWMEPNDASAIGILTEPSFDAANTVILPISLRAGLLPENPPSDNKVTISHYAPEQIVLEVETATPAILEVALPYNVGWQATSTLPGSSPLHLEKADTAVTAVVLEAGKQTITLSYVPNWYRVGAIISIVMLLILIGGSLGIIVRLFI